MHYYVWFLQIRSHTFSTLIFINDAYSLLLQRVLVKIDGWSTNIKVNRYTVDPPKRTPQK